VQGVDSEVFIAAFTHILEAIESTAPEEILCIVTIPDFATTPLRDSFGDPVQTVGRCNLPPNSYAA